MKFKWLLRKLHVETTVDYSTLLYINIPGTHDAARATCCLFTSRPYWVVNRTHLFQLLQLMEPLNSSDAVV